MAIFVMLAIEDSEDDDDDDVVDVDVDADVLLWLLLRCSSTLCIARVLSLPRIVFDGWLRVCSVSSASDSTKPSDKDPTAPALYPLKSM